MRPKSFFFFFFIKPFFVLLQIPKSPSPPALNPCVLHHIWYQILRIHQSFPFSSFCFDFSFQKINEKKKELDQRKKKRKNNKKKIQLIVAVAADSPPQMPPPALPISDYRHHPYSTPTQYLPITLLTSLTSLEHLLDSLTTNQ